MLPLLDSAIGFAAIILMLSLLVKSLTSLIKSYVDYYSRNLHEEVDRFLEGMLGHGLTFLAAQPATSWVGRINWKTVGEEYFTRDKMAILLRQLSPGWTNAGDLDARIDLHLANLRYGFERRMKNLALASGMGLCLLLNINALNIWTSLYTDQQLRTTFAGPYAEKALKLSEEQSRGAQPKPAEQKPAEAKPATPKTPEQLDAERKQLEAQQKAFMDSTRSFLADVKFGVGSMWTNPSIGPLEFLYELLGSLLTGILVSVGAPYWHDALQALSGLRKR